MSDPKHYSGCLYDEDGYFFQNGEGEDYPVNPFSDDEGGEEEDEAW